MQYRFAINLGDTQYKIEFRYVEYEQKKQTKKHGFSNWPDPDPELMVRAAKLLILKKKYL